MRLSTSAETPSIGTSIPEPTRSLVSSVNSVVAKPVEPIEAQSAHAVIDHRAQHALDDGVEHALDRRLPQQVQDTALAGGVEAEPEPAALREHAARSLVEPE